MDKFRAHVGKNGELVFPEEFSRRYGLEAGAQIYVEVTAKGPRLRLPTCGGCLWAQGIVQCPYLCR